MVDHESVQSLAGEVAAGRLSRRDFLVKAAALGYSAAAVGGLLAGKPATALAQDLKEVPREKTLIAVRGGTQGKFTEHEFWNPFPSPAGNHQLGSQMTNEPLAFYSAFANEMVMWLAEGYEY